MMDKLPAAAGAAGLLLGWAAFENTALLCTARYQTALKGMPYTVQLSDLHRRKFGRGQVRLIRAVQAERPELIAVTGDLVSRTETDFSGVYALVRSLCEIAPVIAVPGNHEADLPPESFAAYCDAVRQGGAELLLNRCVTFRGVRFAGLALPSAYFRGEGRHGYRTKRICTAETLRQYLGTCEENTVLLAHDPLRFPAYAEWGAGLTLSGHVHGGIVRIPGIGGLLSPERRFFPRYSRGLYRIGHAEMIVSAGLGKLRLWNPPEIAVISRSP